MIIDLQCRQTHSKTSMAWLFLADDGSDTQEHFKFTFINTKLPYLCINRLSKIV